MCRWTRSLRLRQTVARVAGKEIHIEHIEGPVGVKSRNFSNARMYSIGWEAKADLEEGRFRDFDDLEDLLAELQSQPETS